MLTHERHWSLKVGTEHTWVLCAEGGHANVKLAGS